MLVQIMVFMQIFMFVFFPNINDQNKIVKGINNCEKEIKIENIEIRNDQEWDKALDEVYKIIRIRKDCLFETVDFKTMSSSYSKSKKILKIKPKFKQDIKILENKKNKTKEYQEELKKIVDSWGKNLTDIQKLEKINQYIVKKADYNYKILKYKDDDIFTTKNGFYYYSWQSIMDDGKGVCDAYSGLFNQMCSICGIDSEMLANGEHSWNRAKVNGEWKYFDVTWNDTTGKHHKYFNLTEKQILKDKEHIAE